MLWAYSGCFVFPLIKERKRACLQMRIKFTCLLLIAGGRIYEDLAIA